jgi:hypothetical protein
MALVQVTVPYAKGYDFGVGADLASGSPMGKVVQGAESTVQGAAGATTSFDIRRIHSTEELERKLGIDVQASYGCAAFGAGISARFQFAEDSKIQSSSLFLAVTANVELAFESIDEPTLTEPASALVDRPADFATRYGNMFVRGVARGGLFVGVIQIDTESSDDSESIATELEGSYGLFQADAKTKFDSLTQKYKSEIHISVYHEGGPIDLVMEDIQDPNQLYQLLVKFLQALQNDPDHNAKAYYVTLAPIAIANGPIPPNAAEIQHAQDVLVFCAQERSGMLDNLNLLELISQNQSKYDFPPSTTAASVKQALNGYQADLDLVARCASQAINDVSQAVLPADYAQAQGKQYPQGSMPDPMPTAKAGATVSVPDFSACTSWDQCNQQAAQLHLNATNAQTNETSVGAFKVLSQVPPAGTAVPEGSNLTIVTRPYISDPNDPIHRIEIPLWAAKTEGVHIAVPH